MKPQPPESPPPRAGDILIVDDTPANLQVLAGMLKDRHHKVRPVPNGKLALAAALREPPDLILLDINMPDMNGYQLCELLKADEWLRDIPVIFISALAEPLDKVRAFALGGLDYITKPFQIEELHARVDTHLKLRRQHVELEEARDRLLKATSRIAQDTIAAAKIQKTFLPCPDLKIPGLEVAWVSRPGDELGGYALNLIPLGDGRIALYILDVSGQGVAAALQSVTLSRLLSSPSDPASILLHGKDANDHPDPTPPAAVADQLNRLFRFDKTTGQFATLLYGILDPASHTFRYVSAGHPGPLHLPAGGPALILNSPGRPLGTAEEPYGAQRLNLPAGDRLYLYSDGLTDARNPGGEQFGDSRLLDALTRLRTEPLAATLNILLAELAHWQGAERASDDISILAVEILPTPPMPGSSAP